MWHSQLRQFHGAVAPLCQIAAPTCSPHWLWMCQTQAAQCQRNRRTAPPRSLTSVGWSRSIPLQSRGHLVKTIVDLILLLIMPSVITRYNRFVYGSGRVEIMQLNVAWTIYFHLFIRLASSNNRNIPTYRFFQCRTYIIPLHPTNPKIYRLRIHVLNSV